MNNWMKIAEKKFWTILHIKFIYFANLFKRKISECKDGSDEYLEFEKSASKSLDTLTAIDVIVFGISHCW